MPTALITGITGQDGSYLAELLLEKGYSVVGLVSSPSRIRLQNLRQISDRILFVEGNLLDQRGLIEVVERQRPDEIYNLAARASSKTLVSDPVMTGDLNGLAVARLLEAVRLVDPSIRFCQASSSELFGNSRSAPQNEETPFRPRNPYGVAKLFAHGMVASYREHYGLFACSAILFNHESPRRGEEFVSRRISIGVARISRGLCRVLELGDLSAQRDWGYAGDYVRGMWQMLQAKVASDFVLASGVSRTVQDFCAAAFAHVNLDYANHIVTSPALLRPAESVPLVGDATKARTLLGWMPTVSFEEMVGMMVNADLKALAAH
jgi:GDPmannose 4,6-dehydratase